MIRIKSAGDAALLLEASAAVPGGHQGGNEAAAIAAAVRAAGLPGVVDIVPGAATVLVTFEPGSLERGTVESGSQDADLAAHLRQLASAAAVVPASMANEQVVIDTVYDGPDLADVAAMTGLSVAGVIARHQAAEYLVGWLGFAPGFAYLTGLDPRLAVPRLHSPRQRVPAGSVAVADELTAVYPAASPGGWRLLGRTNAPLWDTGREPPALLAPGSRVRFRAVGRLPEADGRAPQFPDLDDPDLDHLDLGNRWAEVVQPGPLTTVQDLGRAGLAHLGVPASGAADTGSLRLANALVGNGEGAACLEVTLGRLALRFGCDAVVALTGAQAPIRLNDAARPAHETAFSVPAGTMLRLGAPVTGLRSYLAIGGGIDVTPVLTSRSADLLSGLGPAPLRPGQRLPVGRPRSRPGSEAVRRPGAARPSAVTRTSSPATVTRLRVIAGPRDDWFTDAAITALTEGSYEVTAASNRSGLRLAGPELRRARSGELPSEGMAAGSLQVSHDGQPILLLADHPTTGGYPVIGVVVSGDLGLAAQLRPGQRIRFSLAASPSSG